MVEPVGVCGDGLGFGEPSTHATVDLGLLDPRLRTSLDASQLLGHTANRTLLCVRVRAQARPRSSWRAHAVPRGTSRVLPRLSPCMDREPPSDPGRFKGRHNQCSPRPGHQGGHNLRQLVPRGHLIGWIGGNCPGLPPREVGRLLGGGEPSAPVQVRIDRHSPDVGVLIPSRAHLPPVGKASARTVCATSSARWRSRVST